MARFFSSWKTPGNTDEDLPTHIWATGTQEWRQQNGKLHRDPKGDLPARICANGDQEWWKNKKNASG